MSLTIDGGSSMCGRDATEECHTCDKGTKGFRRSGLLIDRLCDLGVLKNAAVVRGYTLIP